MKIEKDSIIEEQATIKDENFVEIQFKIILLLMDGGIFLPSGTFA